MAKTDINMLEGTIWDKILKFAFPLALTSILQQLFNSADLAVIGQFCGRDALAAVGATGIVINLFLNIFIGLSIGTNVVVANMLGCKDYLRTKQAVHTSIVIAFFSGIIVAVLGVVFARDILLLLDTPLEIMDLAVYYLQILLGGTPTMMLYNFSASILRSKGDTKRPLYVMIASGIMNVVLNVLFVVGFGMNVAGVAYATVIAMTFSCVCLMYFLVKEKGPLQLRWAKLSVNKSAFIHICKVGLPCGLQGMMFSLSNIIIQVAMNNLGAEYIAGSAIALNYEFAMFFIFSSFAQACTTFVGQNYGAGNISRCRRIVKQSILLNLGISGSIGIAMSIFAGPLTMIFTNDATVFDISVLRIRYILTCSLLNITLETLSGAMRGFNYSLQPAIACMLGICVLRIIYVLTYYSDHPSFDNLMLIYPVSWAATLMAAIPMYLYVVRKVAKEKIRLHWGN